MRAALVLVMMTTAAAADPPTWTHIRQVSRCRVLLEPGDRDELRTKMQDRLVAPVQIQISPLGDHVEWMRSSQLPGPAHAPRTTTEARQLARDFLVANADLFGVGFELPNIDLVPAKSSHRGWAFTAPIRRTVVVAQSYEVMSRVDVELDPRGRVTFASVGPGLLPRFAICDGPQLRKFDPRLLANVVGARLADGLVVERADVVSIDAGVIALDEATYAVAYTIVVDHDHHRWRFVVDGDTGDVISIQDLL
jgi:hypothetical protein